MMHYRNYLLHRAVAGVIVLGSALVARAGYNQTYVNNDSPTVAGYVQVAQLADYWWANSFTAPAAGEYLTQLDVSFGLGFAAGTPVSVMVYEDPSNSNNPDDLQLLTQTTGEVGSSGQTDLYLPEAFNIPSTYVTGDYFVAVEVNNAPASAYGPPISPSNPVGRGFMALNVGSDAGTMTPTNIENADQPPISLDELAAGTSKPTYNLFVGAKGRATQYAEAQETMVLDDFATGNASYSTSYSGGVTSASSAMGGNRGLTFVNVGGSGSVTVANGVLTVSNGQAAIFYGGQYNGNAAYQFGYNTYMHLNASGYDTLQLHFLEDNTAVQLLIFGGNNGAPITYTTDASGNVDFNIAGQDWSDLNYFDFDIYSYSKTTVLDSISLLTNPISGDVNGDGILNADDYALIDRGLAEHLTGYVNGDLNGDGVVDYKDYLIIDTAFAQEYGLSQSLIASREAEFGQDYVNELEAAVPEPASLAMCGLALPMFLRRKRA